MDLDAVAGGPLHSVRAYRLHEEAEVPESRHRSLFLTRPLSEDAPVFLFFTGLHESPWFYRWLLDPIYAAGFDVVVVRLPGHWERWITALDSTHRKCWLSIADMFMASVARRPVVVAGHSTGGLLAAHLVVQNPEKLVGPELVVSNPIGLVLLAPAIALAWPTRWSVGLAETLPWLKTALLQRPDSIHVSYKSTHAAREVERLCAEADLVQVLGRISKPALPPLFMLKVAGDTAVSCRAIDAFFSHYPSEQKRNVTLGPLQAYFHFSVAGTHSRNRRLASDIVQFLKGT